jgi:hypothetical protein
MNRYCKVVPLVSKLRNWFGSQSPSDTSCVLGSGLWRNTPRCDHTIEPPLICQAEGVTVLLSRRSKRSAAPEGDPGGPCEPIDSMTGHNTPQKKVGRLVCESCVRIICVSLGFVQKYCTKLQNEVWLEWVDISKN